MSNMTSVCLCTHVSSEKRLKDLEKVLQSLLDNLADPSEVVIVDDRSPLDKPTNDLLLNFAASMLKYRPNIPVTIIKNEKNLKHAASQNRAMREANGDVLIHIEDDIVVEHKGWNQVFAKCLQDHPEVGQVIPKGSGRGEWIPRPGYDEYMWGLGGLWAVRKEIFEKIGGWDEYLQHQLEPDYNFRVRMEGWRLAEISDFAMSHLGEGDEADTFERQAQITIGVYNFLKKWNRRFMGFYGYHTVPCMSPDDFPINVFFRRQLAAWFAAAGKKADEALSEVKKQHPDWKTDVMASGASVMSKCRLNENPDPFKYPGHWGQYELVKLIRPTGRERENEMIEKMGNNHVWRDEPELHKQVRELHDRFFKAGKVAKPWTDGEVAEFLKGKELEFEWWYDVKPCTTPKS